MTSRVEFNTCYLVTCFIILLYGLWCVQTGETLQTSTAGQECTPSIYGGDEETCYVIENQSLSYEDAKNYCRQSGLGTLVKLEPFKNIKEIVRSIAGNTAELWIGLDDIEEEGKYRWSRDHTELPSNASSWFRSVNNETNDCVVLDSQGNFKLIDCNAQHSVTCQLDLCAQGNCACYSGLRAVLSNSRCVFTTGKEGNFTEQDMFCESLLQIQLRDSSNLTGGAIQLHPWNQTKKLVLNQIRSNTSQAKLQITWIGLSDRVAEGEITFTSNETNSPSPDSFVDFNAANTEILDCVVINPQTGLLDYEDCSQKRPFICQSGRTPSPLITGLIVSSAVSAIVIVVVVIFCWCHTRQSKRLSMESQNGGRIGDGGIVYQTNTDIEFLEGTYHQSLDAPQDSVNTTHGSREVPHIEINNHLYEDSVSLSNGGRNRSSGLAQGMNVYAGNQANYEDVDSLSDKSERTLANGLLDKTKLIPSPVTRSESIQSRKLPNKPDTNNKWRTLPKPEATEEFTADEQNQNYFEIRNKDYDEINAGGNYEDDVAIGEDQSHPMEMVYNDLYDHSSSPTTEMVYNDAYDSSSPTTEMVYNDAYESTDIDNNIRKEKSSFKRATDVYDDIDS